MDMRGQQRPRNGKGKEKEGDHKKAGTTPTEGAHLPNL